MSDYEELVGEARQAAHEVKHSEHVHEDAVANLFFTLAAALELSQDELAEARAREERLQKAGRALLEADDWLYNLREGARYSDRSWSDWRKARSDMKALTAPAPEPSQKPLPPLAERVEIDTRETGFTLRVDEDTDEPTPTSDAERRPMLEFLHYVTQVGQPFGSESRKCSKCGIMVWPELQRENTPRFTDDLTEWAKAQDNCSRSAAQQQGER